MLSPHQLTTQIEQSVNCSMSSDESRRLGLRLKSPHASLSRSSRFMRVFSSIIGTLIHQVKRLRHQLLVGHRIAAQLVRDNLSGPTVMRLQQAPEEAFRRLSIAPGLQINICNVAILVDRPPKIVLLAVDLYEHLVDIAGITVAQMARLQAPGIQTTELGAPEANSLVADSDATLSQNILDVSAAQIKPAVEPYCIGNDVGRESMNLVGVHDHSLPASAH
jgi:hypothetical protein